MISMDLQVKLSEWRRKSRDGTITMQELGEALEHLREGRKAAAKSSTASKARAAKTKPDSNTMLDELEGL